MKNRFSAKLLALSCVLCLTALLPMQSASATGLKYCGWTAVYLTKGLGRDGKVATPSNPAIPGIFSIFVGRIGYDHNYGVDESHCDYSKNPGSLLYRWPTIIKAIPALQGINPALKWGGNDLETKSTLTPRWSFQQHNGPNYANYVQHTEIQGSVFPGHDISQKNGYGTYLVVKRFADAATGKEITYSETVPVKAGVYYTDAELITAIAADPLPIFYTPPALGGRITIDTDTAGWQAPP